METPKFKPGDIVECVPHINNPHVSHLQGQFGIVTESETGITEWGVGVSLMYMVSWVSIPHPPSVMLALYLRRLNEVS